MFHTILIVDQATIRAAAPEAQEAIKYGMPTFTLVTTQPNGEIPEKRVCVGGLRPPTHTLFSG
ncbi:MAG: hypothetical protein FJ010_12195 [Chloroflexi bacterium]|nr:hypothetical protein [Chloroflexota bacterium]